MASPVEVAGQARGRSYSVEYLAWRAMIYRCTWPSNGVYSSYGGRGIGVHRPWYSFDRFLEDMGPCPVGCQLGRRDTTRGYTPANTGWLTRSETQRARGVGRRLRCRGQTLTVLEWSEQLGIPTETIRGRLRVGWSVAQALGFKERPDR